MEGDLFRSVGEVENKRQAMVVNRNTENNRRKKKKKLQKEAAKFKHKRWQPIELMKQKRRLERLRKGAEERQREPCWFPEWKIMQ